MPLLSEIEVRVLGALIEKQITTPEYYPLTLNALTAACNQKNNRHPVTSFSESEIEEALYTLRDKNLAYVFHGSTSRVPKYKHVVPEILHISAPEVAVLCVLMLSGPQTVGELRTRGSRLYEFHGLEEVEETLRSLTAREEEPLVKRLPRQAGQKEARFAQLLSGEPPLEEVAEPAQSPRSARHASEADRLTKLEEHLKTLAEQVESLSTQFAEFKKQFE